MSTSTPTLDQLDQVKTQAEAAKALLGERQDAVRKMYEAQQKQVADGDYWFSATLKASSMIFYTSVKLEDMTFTNSSTVLEFDGTSYGPGLGKVTAFGGGYTYKDPDWLVGKECSFELGYAAFPVAGVQMIIWYEGAVIAAFDAVGGGLGIGVTGGTGTFKRA